MIKNLTKHGNSLALVIDRGVLDLLNIKKETPLSITTDGECLIITPVRDEERSEDIQLAKKKMHSKYGNVLKRLAN